jgi:hypothetical protein
MLGLRSKAVTSHGAAGDDLNDLTWRRRQARPAIPITAVPRRTNVDDSGTTGVANSYCTLDCRYTPSPVSERWSLAVPWPLRAVRNRGICAA